MSANQHGKIRKSKIKNHFTTLPNALLRDVRISLQCAGFIAYVMTNSDEWEISIPVFMEFRKIKKSRMYSILKEAEKNGYLKRKKYKNEKGQFAWDYEIAAEPIFSNNFSSTENPDMVFPDTENQDTKKEQDKKEQLKNKESISKDIDKKDAPTVAGVDAPSVKFKIELSQEEITKLHDLIGKEKTEYYSEAIEDYVLSIGKPKKYKSHFHTILSWAKRDNKNVNKKSEKNEAVKERNIMWLKDQIANLERVGARGNLYYTDTQVIDSVLNKYYDIYAKNMIDIVDSWNQYRR